MNLRFRRHVRMRIFCFICVAVCLAGITFPALSDSQIRKEKLSDGVEHWYSPQSTDPKSSLTKKFEEIYKVIFPGGRSQPFGKSIAFLVGVDKYHNLSPQLPSVENDLVQMREFLLKKAGFDELYIARNDVVNRDIIEKYVKGIFSSKMKENDRLLFYYSGHGADGQGKTGYMQFAKAEKGVFWGQHVLAISSLEDWSREIGIKHMLFILDCCASGLAFTTKTTIDESGKLLLQTLSGNGSRTVLTAGTADEKTYALDSRKSQGNGVFTKAFLNAFESHSISHQNNALITISDLYAGIEKEMAKFRAAEGKPTTPRIWKLQEMDYRGTFVFLNLRAGSAMLTDEQAKVLGVSTIPKGPGPESGDPGKGIIEIFSSYEGRIHIDGEDKGVMLRNQRRQFFQQLVGNHRVEIKGSKSEAKEVTVDNGMIAYISFGLESPIDKNGTRPVGKLIMESVEQLSGDVYIDSYKVGILKEDDTIEISNLLVGNHQYRIVGANQTANGTVEIKPNQVTYISVRPSPPMNLRIIQ